MCHSSHSQWKRKKYLMHTMFYSNVLFRRWRDRSLTHWVILLCWQQLDWDFVQQKMKFFSGPWFSKLGSVCLFLVVIQWWRSRSITNKVTIMLRGISTVHLNLFRTYMDGPLYPMSWCKYLYSADYLSKYDQERLLLCIFIFIYL